MTLRLVSVTASIATTLALVATPASAIDVTIYNLEATAVDAFGEPNYGTVTLTQNDSSVGFLVELRQDLNFVTAGSDGGSNAVFSFNAIGVAAGDISGIMDKGGKTFAVAQPGNNSPFGRFTFGILCVSNCAHTGFGDPLAFTVANATLGDFNGSSTGGTPNAVFAAEVFMTGSGTRGTVGSIAIAAPVPEPEIAALMLAGLAALGFVGRRRKSA